MAVEMDECICSIRKYMKGKSVEKEKILTVGPFEVPTTEAVVEEESVLRFVQRKEKRLLERKLKKKYRS